MSTTATKRLASEFKEMVQNPLSQEGIHIWYDDNNIMEIYALIIGPDDSCYQGGFYFFKMIIPQNYPFSPPKVTFLTQAPGGKRIRMHPNLYADGKVCLTLLNTYVGPPVPNEKGWSPTFTLRTVLLTIQSIMDNYPLRNEPGYSDSSNDDPPMQAYNRMIEYWNLRSAVIYWSKTIRTGQGDKLTHFADIVENYFLEHYDEYLARIIQFKEKYQGQGIWSAYDMTVTLDYEKLEQELVEWYQKLTGITSTASPSMSAPAGKSAAGAQSESTIPTQLATEED